MVNNSIWVIDEFTEWINEGIKSIEELANKTTGEEKIRLTEKLNTMIMVKGKLDELMYD